jgi:formiminoglutamase
VPLACVERIVDAVMASGKVAAADIAELNPRYDRDGQTARVAARLVARIARAADGGGFLSRAVADASPLKSE